jgi:hypothetical protein
MRRTLAATVVTVALALGGCHLLLPLGGRPGDGSASDGPRTDATSVEGGGLDRPSDRSSTETARDARPGERAALDGGIVPPPPGTICSKDKWCWENPLPHGNTLHGVWGTSATDVYAVGEMGTIWHYDGTQVTVMASPTTQTLWGVWGRGAEVFAVGDSGTVVRFDGKSWSLLSTGATETLWSVWTAPSKDVYVASDLGRVFQYAGGSWAHATVGTGPLYGVSGDITMGAVIAVGEGGQTWHLSGGGWEKKISSTTLDLYSVSLSGSNAVAVGENGVVVLYNGITWSPGTPASVSLNGVWCESASQAAVVGQGGAAYSLGGTTLTTQSTGIGASLEGAWGTHGAGGSTLFAVGWGGTFLQTTGAGTWVPLVAGPKADLYGVLAQGKLVAAAGTRGTLVRRQKWQDWTAFSTSVQGWLEGLWPMGSDLIAVGELGGAVRCPLPGSLCQTITTDPKADLEAIYPVSSSEVLVVGGDWTGSSGLVRRFDGTWTNVPVTSAYLHGVWASGADAFAVGRSGAIQRCSLASCTPMSSGVTGDLWSVWGSNPTRIFAVGDAGTILRYDGTSWQAQTSNTSSTLWDVTGCSNGEVYAAGTAGTIVRLSGGVWAKQETGTYNTFYGISCEGGEVYAVGDYGTILHRVP